MTCLTSTKVQILIPEELRDRLVYSRIVTLARRFCAEVDIAALPFLEYMKGRDLNASEPALAGAQFT